MNRKIVAQFCIGSALLVLGPSVAAQETIKNSYDLRGRLIQVLRASTAAGCRLTSYSYDRADNRQNVSVGPAGPSGAGLPGCNNDPAGSDINGDGRDDIVWRNNDGSFTDWLANANGGFSSNDAHAWATPALSWKVVGLGDFNGDGRDDVLWRQDDGLLSSWSGQANGGFVDNGVNSSTIVPTSWKVAGIGDFNGDGRGDILWRSDAGTVSNSLGTSNGGFIVNDANASKMVATSWKVVGTGDFNGDGRSDILWRQDDGLLSSWSGTANGGFVDNGGNSGTMVATSWKVVGTGDFNGDGRGDILWRNDSGMLSSWSGTATGGFVDNGGNSGTMVATNFKVVSTGDFNGDGRSDILWRSDAGAVSNWLATNNGGFVVNDANAYRDVPTSWHVQGG